MWKHTKSSLEIVIYYANMNYSSLLHLLGVICSDFCIHEISIILYKNRNLAQWIL